MNSAFSPTFIVFTPKSHPFITCPPPILKVKGLSFVWSNILLSLFLPI